MAALEERRDWLVVFDNAQVPADLAGMLPRGGGHVLITSRDPARGADRRAAGPGRVFPGPSRWHSWARGPGRDEPAATAELAEELGDLPLALAQAAAYIDTRAVTVSRLPGLVPGPGAGAQTAR